MENDGAYIEGPILTVPWIELFGSSRGAGGGTSTGRRFFRSRFLVTPPVLGVTPSLLLLNVRSAQEIFKTPSKYSDWPILIATLL